jgi:hypothetical protein
VKDGHILLIRWDWFCSGLTPPMPIRFVLLIAAGATLVFEASLLLALPLLFRLADLSADVQNVTKDIFVDLFLLLNMFVSVRVRTFDSSQKILFVFE